MKKFLIIMNIFFGLCVVFLGFSKATVFKSVETEELIIRSDKGKSFIKLGLNDGKQMISFSANDGKNRLILAGGDKPAIIFKNKEGKTIGCIEMGVSNELTMMFNDNLGVTHLAVEGGKTPGIYMRNNDGKTVGSWTILKDNNSVGFGLAQDNGMPSAVLRGGINPSVAFFNHTGDPLCAVGISQDIPHLLISGNNGSEGVLIHGGKPAGMMMVDEDGIVKIFISKEGVFQGKDSSDIRGKEENKRLFTLRDEIKELFPDAKKEQR